MEFQAPHCAHPELPLQGQEVFPFTKIIQTVSGAHPAASYWMGARVLFLGIKQSGCAVDHSI